MFDNAEIRMFVHDMISVISANYNLPIQKIGFDSDHVHFEVDIRIKSTMCHHGLNRLSHN